MTWRTGLLQTRDVSWNQEAKRGTPSREKKHPEAPRLSESSPDNREASSAPLTIAYLITRADDLGGAQIHVRDLSSELQRRGHRVVVMAGREGVLAEQLRTQGVRFIGLRHLVRRPAPFADLRALVEIFRRLREMSPDLISLHSSKAGTLGRIAGRALGIPTIFTAHGWAFTEGKSPGKRRLYRSIERLMAPLARRIVTVSEADRRLALSEGVGRPDQLETIHNGMPAIPGALLADPGRTPPRLTMVARFAPQKDHQALLAALSTLRNLDWRLDLVGEGSTKQEVKERARSLGLEKRVSFLGFRTDVAQVLSRSQIFVLASNWEGFPRSILEAMRAGLPVVASDVGGVGEAVRPGVTGVLVPRGDVAALVPELRRLLRDPDLRIRMGERGRSRFEEEFTFELFVERTLRLYADVLGLSAVTAAAPRPRGNEPESGSLG